MTKPLPYFPKTALACVEAGFSRGHWADDEEKSLKKMADAFNDGYMSQAKETMRIFRVFGLLGMMSLQQKFAR